eukprot:m.244318 g.244318  ORF g.244318 m.244318 type:complete len:650 (-) comp14431_c0_seq1:192-2141(-)
MSGHAAMDASLSSDGKIVAPVCEMTRGLPVSYTHFLLKVLDDRIQKDTGKLAERVARCNNIDFVKSLRSMNMYTADFLEALTEVVLHLSIGDDVLSTLVFSLVASVSALPGKFSTYPHLVPACSRLLSLTILHPAFDAATRDEARAYLQALSNPSRPASDSLESSAYIEGSKLNQWRSGEPANAATADVSSTVVRRRTMQPRRDAPPLPPGIAPVPALTEDTLKSGLSPFAAAFTGSSTPSLSTPPGSLRSAEITPRHSMTEDDGEDPDDDDDDSRPGSHAGPVMNDRFHKVKHWLKGLRLHKYYRLFEQMTYLHMIRLTSDDLERLGIAARGARTKMLKSIELLRLRNESVEQSLMQMDAALDSGPMRPTLQGLCELLQMPSPYDELGAVDNIFVNTFVSVVSKAYTLLGMMYSSGGHIALKEDLEHFVELGDLCMRSEIFPVEHKQRLFLWKSECQKMLDQLSAMTWDVRLRQDTRKAPMVPPGSMTGAPPSAKQQASRMRRPVSDPRRPPPRPTTQKPRISDPRLLMQLHAMPDGYGHPHMAHPLNRNPDELAREAALSARRPSGGNIIIPPMDYGSMTFSASTASLNSASSGTSDHQWMVYGHPGAGADYAPDADADQQLLEFESLCVSITEHTQEANKRNTASF